MASPHQDDAADYGAVHPSERSPRSVPAEKEITLRLLLQKMADIAALSLLVVLVLGLAILRFWAGEMEVVEIVEVVAPVFTFVIGARTTRER